MRKLLQIAFHIERSRLAIAPAVRAAAVILFLLGGGIAIGQTEAGIAAAGGAIGLGTIGLTGTYRQRALIMLPGCFALAVSAFVGSLAGQTGWLFVIIAGIWAFASGMLSSLGQTGMTIGLLSTAMVIVFSHIPLTPAQAAQIAVAMFLGGLLQTIVAILPWPFDRYGPERRAVATGYRALAMYVADTSQYHQAADAIKHAASTLRTGDTGGTEGSMLRDLLVDADRMQLEFVGLADARHGLPADEAAQVDQLDNAAGHMLQALAVAIEHDLTPIGLADPAHQIDTAVAELSGQAHDARGLRHYAAARGAALSRELQVAADLTARLQNPDATVITERPWDNTRGLAVMADHPAAETLRANLNLDSATFRHAIRLCIALVIGTTLYQVVPLGRGYWVPFTSLMVLRPDFTTTFTRGLARYAGTLVGVVLTTVLVALVPLDNVTLVALLTAAAFLSFAVFGVNYALYTMLLTAMVVFLEAITGAPPITTALDRLIDTTIGAVLALAIYALWPTWERRQVPDNIAALFHSLRDYVGAVMHGYADPTTFRAAAARRSRLSARRAFSNAQSSVQRAHLEPARERSQADAWNQVLDATYRLSRYVLELDVDFEDARQRQPLPEVAPFASKVDATLAAFEAVVCKVKTPAAINSDQDTPDDVEALRQRAARDDSSYLMFFIAEAERIMDSLDTIGHVLLTSTQPAAESGRS